MTTATAEAPSMEEVMEFAFKVVNELGAAMAAPHVYIGDQLGLFKTLLPEEERVLGPDHPDTHMTRIWIDHLGRAFKPKRPQRRR